MRTDGGLRPLFRRKLAHLGQWTTIETGGTEQGVPDTHLLIKRGTDVFVEMKRTTGWTPRFKPGQVAWIHTRWRYGGRVLIATRRECEAGARRAAADELYLTSGRYVQELCVSGVRAVPHVQVHAGGPERWDWTAIGEALRKET